MEWSVAPPPLGGSGQRLMGPGTWAAYLLVGILGVLVFLFCPRVAGIVVFALVMGSGVMAAIVGVRRHRPARAAGWWLLIAALAVSVLANTMFAIGFEVGGQAVFGSVVDGVYFLMYALLIAGLTVIVPRRSWAWTVAELIDAGVVTAGVAAIWWTVVMQPFLHQPGASSAMVGIWSAYAVCDLLVLTGLARLIFTTGSRRPASGLLTGSMFALLAGDVVYFARVGLDGYISVSNLDNALWLTWALLFGAASLHPSAASLGRVRRATRGARPGRLLAFAGLAFLCPLAVVTGVRFAHRYAASTAWYDTLVPTLLGAIISTLLVVRLGMLARVAQRRAAMLDRQAGELTRALRDQEMLQRQLTHRALHDPLTGLPNRALLLERLERALARRPVTGSPALLLVGLDGFADLNDTLGHEIGDQVLVELSARLLGLLSESDSLARVGADEFALLLEDPAATDPALRAARIVAASRIPYAQGDREVVVTASVGYRVMDTPLTAAEALRDAGVALRAAKADGRNRVAAFDVELRSNRLDTARLVDDLRRALTDGEFRVHYQPVVDSRTAEVRSLEALLRWTKPDGTSVPPDEFIPAAEDSGLIIPIGAWVLRHAIAQAAEWHHRFGLSLSVNVSGHQLPDPGFAETVLDALSAGGLPPTALILEITETALVAVTGSAATDVHTCLQLLRDHGIRIAIDDFGTGYASLSYLRHLPVDILKIDRSFVHSDGGSAPGPEDHAFIRAILHLSENLRLSTIAEGVETPQQAALLQHMNCHLAQGFLFHRPMTPEAIDQLLAAMTSGPEHSSPRPTTAPAPVGTRTA
ncbi:bifunctional diguanylate cyclase/phosphodiesterase [Actinoplanes sp. NPDC051475]|uniref:putative bifunctional diguanylate cyclase/phosphodiesterase n=1 Tax=Actinoplanes sp. NPDC051475 TaxID=3157225 RepID=UPI00344D7E4E